MLLKLIIDLWISIIKVDTLNLKPYFKLKIDRLLKGDMHR